MDASSIPTIKVPIRFAADLRVCRLRWPAAGLFQTVRDGDVRAAGPILAENLTTVGASENGSGIDASNGSSSRIGFAPLLFGQERKTELKPRPAKAGAVSEYAHPTRYAHPTSPWRDGVGARSEGAKETHGYAHI